MSTRRLSQAAMQAGPFAFNAENEAWAERQIRKYPTGRQASAVIPLLWRAQEQNGGWLTRASIEHVADKLSMPYIRALEVATFYFMFQLGPVGRNAHVQICGTTPCMLRGSEDLAEVCKRKISAHHNTPSADGTLSWEEVECLGACTNAPMAQIHSQVKGGAHSDFYEDLTQESLEKILEAFRKGDYPKPGPQNDRFSSEPTGGATALTAREQSREAVNSSRTLAEAQGAAR